MKKYVVVDFDPQDIDNLHEWEKLIKGLNEKTSEKWELFGKKIKDTSFHSKERYKHYFLLSWKLFCDRKNISGIVANQQFYGIIYAFYCRLFHVKKTTHNMVVSFIYNKKKGFLGKVYHKFIQYAVCSKYVDELIVHSESEVEYYAKLLNIRKEKLVFCPLGITDDSFGYEVKDIKDINQGYILGVGNSNRDFQFMEDALLGQKYDVHIFSDGLEDHKNQNISAKKGVPVSEYYTQLANCFCSVIPIANPNFSSGQLIMLQSYAFRKPVIITKSNVNDKYIGQGNAIVIEKNKEELLNAIEQLKDSDYYDNLVDKAHSFFEENFSMYAMGKNMGNILKGKMHNER